MPNFFQKSLQPTVEWLTRLAGMESAATYRILVEHSLVGVYLIQDDRFSYCNPRMAEIFGYESNDEIISTRTVADLVWPEDRELVLGNVRRRIEGKVKTVHYGFRGLRRDGAMIEVEVLGSRVIYHGRPAVIGTLLDMTAERQTRRQLNLYANALANTAEAVIVLGADRHIVTTNKAFQHITGYGDEEAAGRTPEFLRSGHHHESFYDYIWKRVPGDRVWRGELWVRRKDGEAFPTLASLSLVQGVEGEPDHYVCVFSDLSRFRQIEEKLDFLSHYDPLTELPNRALLRERLGEALRRADSSDRMVAVLLLDLDAFKRINESLGHDAGDEVLRGVADRLRAAAINGATVARMGGDEYAIVLEDVKSTDEIGHVANRLLQLFEKPFSQDGDDIYTSASIGIGVYPQDGTTADALLKQTDTALYGAKSRGRNLYQYASSEMNARALETLQISNALRQSLERQEFRLVYQPIVSLEDEHITSMEALLRWTHQNLGNVSPEKFIPVAEQSGHIGLIGLWVIRRACEQLAEWREMALPQFSLAINVSLNQLHQPNFVDIIRGALREFGVPPEALRIEITENVMMSDPEHIQGVLRAVTEAGLRVAVDDFGKGYSSLSYLKMLPVHYIKIDRSFVHDLRDGRSDAAIIHAIIAMAHSLNIRMVAEGVENRYQCDLLRDAGCQEAQGWLFAKPQEARDVPKLFRKAG